MTGRRSVGAKSKRKGAAGERAWAQYIEGMRVWWHLHDVFGLGRYWEVKRVANGYTQAYLALEEYVEHNEHIPEEERTPPVVAVKHDHKPWIVIQYADDWLEEHENPSPKPGR